MPDVLTIPGGIQSPSPDGTFSFKGINGKLAGAFLLGSLPSNGNKVFVPTQVFIGIVQGAGITTPVSLSIGTDAGVWANIIGITALTGLPAGKVAALPFLQAYPWITAGQAVNLNITTPGIAAGAITLQLLVLGQWV